jgi:hypothetical protein
MPSNILVMFKIWHHQIYSGIIIYNTNVKEYTFLNKSEHLET